MEQLSLLAYFVDPDRMEETSPSSDEDDEDTENE